MASSDDSDAGAASGERVGAYGNAPGPGCSGATLRAGSVDFDALAGGRPYSHTGLAGPPEWRLTIVFHPDTARIGEVATSPAAAPAFELGRGLPRFAAPDAVGAGDMEGGNTTTPRGIDEPHISRRAFRIEQRDEQWLLLRDPGRSRLRVDGEELSRERCFSERELRRGVVLTLAQRVVLHLRLHSESPRGKSTAGTAPRLHRDLLGVSPAMEALRRDIARAAESGDDVLLIGPTGSGKECVARAIHDLGSPDPAPWVAVNMAALPGDIAAASLFGARRGAYTGADADRPGYFQQADGGTLFLDEVGDCPQPLQPMLLRALQEREIQVVGGKTRHVALRVIAAMERDPDSMQDQFRPALRYRLGAQEIRVPTLAARAEDVGLLAATVLREKAAARGEPWRATGAGQRELAVWACCFERLALYHWPGNVRELQHVAARLHSVDDDLPHLPALLQTDPDPRLAAQQGEAGGPTAVREAPARPRRLAELSDAEVAAAWRSAGYEVAAVARELGVSRPAIYRRVQQIEECRLASDVPLAELLAVLDDCRGDLAATARQLAVSQRGLQARLRASGVRLRKAGRELANDIAPAGAADPR